MNERIKESVMLTVGGQDFFVTDLAGEEQLSQLFRFDLKCSIEGQGPDPDDLIGAIGTITLRDGRGAMRVVTGIVSEAETFIYDSENSSMEIAIQPHAFRLTLGRDCRCFQHMTVVDIVKEIVAGAGPTRWDIQRSYPERVYTVQYREDDWTFIQRLLEQEGIYMWFDHADGSTLVFADHSPASPEPPGGAAIEFAYASGMTADREAMDEFGPCAKATPDRFTMHSFDPNKPNFKVQATTGSGPLEVYDAPGGGPESPDVCQTRVSDNLEEAAAHGYTVIGRAVSVRYYPGVVVELSNHPFPALDGAYVVTKSRIVSSQRKRTDVDDTELRSWLHGVPRDVPYRPPQTASFPIQAGIQSGIVTGASGDEVMPDEQARVRVQQHWDRVGKRDEKAGTWMRVAQRGSAESMLFPRVGWTVMTFNQEGTVDAPSVICRIHDGDHMPPYELPANKTRLVFKTATTPGGGSFNEIRFEDKKGQEEIFMDASKNMVLATKNAKNQTVEHDHRREIARDRKLDVGSTHVDVVERNHTLTIGGNQSVDAGGTKSKGVSLDEDETIGGSRTVTAAMSQAATVGVSRTLAVGGALINVSLGQITYGAGLCTTLVGGVHLRGTFASIQEDVAQMSVQLVGGAKIEIAKTDRGLQATGRYFETVGGMMLLKTSDAYNDTSDTVSDWTVLGPHTAKAPKILFSAPDKIEIKCGASVVRILPESIEIDTPMFDLGGAKMDVKTKIVDHNA